MEFSLAVNTAGLVSAIGSLAYDDEISFPGYQIAAFDASNTPVSLSTFG